MNFIDTHTHLYLSDFGEEKDEVVSRAIDSGVDRLIFPNVDVTTIPLMKSLHEKFPRNTFMAMGLHPTEIGEDWERNLATVEEELSANRSSYIAVGEIGMDLYWDKTFLSHQREAFSRQIELALRLNLPVIIHCREALDEVLEILSSFPEKPRGVFHSFGGTADDVKRIREVGDFFFGINGIVTFKNSTLKSVLPAIGIDRILLETDAPYLAPVPKRGRRNESSYLVHTAAAVADSLGISFEEVARATTTNALNLFAITQ